jgi:hypothetical protein
MSADETFLEAFIESSIGTIPNEIRRNLAHMRSLDQTYDSIIQELRECEEDYLSRAHDIIFNLPVESRQEPPKKKRKTSSGSADSNDGNNRQDSSEAKDEEMPGAIGSGNEEEDDSSDDDEKIEALSNPKEGIPVSVPIFKPASDSDDDDDDDTNEDMKSKTQLIIPTIEELRQQIQDPTALLRIAILRRDARQMVEEKKSNANQTFCIVDDAIKKLNSDIEKFETLLKTTGQYETAVPTGGALPNDLAAIQVTPNSQDWILAKVISHDAQTGMYNLSDEDIESNKSTWFVVFWWLLSSFVVRNGIQSSSQTHNSKYLQYVYLS